MASADDSGVVTAGTLFPARTRRGAWPPLHGDVITAVFLGGCLGGYLRYAVGKLWPVPPDGFPWATFGVNTAGAFLLGLIVVAADLVPSRYLRPLVGTGFCGALTTFSAVVVSTDELVAHHHRGTAAWYLVASIVCGLAAGWLGLLIGRAATGRPQARDRRSSP